MSEYQFIPEVKKCALLKLNEVLIRDGYHVARLIDEKTNRSLIHICVGNICTPLHKIATDHDLSIITLRNRAEKGWPWEHLLGEPQSGINPMNPGPKKRERVLHRASSEHVTERQRLIMRYVSRHGYLTGRTAKRILGSGWTQVSSLLQKSGELIKREYAELAYRNYYVAADSPYALENRLPEFHPSDLQGYIPALDGDNKSLLADITEDEMIAAGLPLLEHHQPLTTEPLTVETEESKPEPKQPPKVRINSAVAGRIENALKTSWLAMRSPIFPGIAREPESGVDLYYQREANANRMQEVAR